MPKISGEGDGLRGQNSLHFHVGLGNATNADRVSIEWPSGTVQDLPNVAAGQFLTVIEPGGEPQLAATREKWPGATDIDREARLPLAIETTTALPGWESANLTVTVTDSSGAVTFPAPSATSGEQRFYRAVWQ